MRWELAPDLALALRELDQDPLAYRLDPALRERLAKEALRAGEEAAEWLMDGRLCQSPHALASQLGVAVVETGESSPAYRVRASYECDLDATPPTGCITLYRPEIERTASLVSPHLSASVSAHEVAAVCVAHELFHHLEETVLGNLSHSLPPVTLWRLGGWHRTAPVRRVREVGAHAFAKRLVGLGYLPCLWDHLCLLAEGHVPSDRLRLSLL